MPPILSHTRVAHPEAEPKLWLLVLHGIFGAGRNWGSIARRLVEARPEWGAILVDLRLHGGSTGFAPPHTVAAAAADVDELTASLALPTAAVLGHSFGGKVALAFARHHADQLRQCWVVDSTLAVREPSGSAWQVLQLVRSLPESFDTRETLVHALEARGLSRPLGQWMAMNLERNGEGYRWKLDWEGVEEMLRDFYRTDLWEVIEEPPAEVEVHVVRANDSTALGEEDVRRVEAAGEANGRVFLHPVDGGHWINAENPDAVVRLLAAMLP